MRISRLRSSSAFGLGLCFALGLTACSSDDGAQKRDAPAATGATPTAATANDAASRPDVHSYARPAEARVTHVSLELAVNFKSSTLAGVATLTIAKQPSVERIVLDTHGLLIEDVTDEGGAPLDYAFGDDDPLLGKSLTVTIFEETERIAVRYRTQPQAAALLWLPPELTEGKVHPYLFSQGQAILTRTWIPLQDTPSVRVTYDAKIVVPGALRAIMSAENGPVTDAPKAGAGEGLRVFTFTMPQAIPPYLIALAVGDLQFQELGPRTGVYAESATLKAAAEEFSDVEKMMTSVESMYGEYRWGRYDILVLPPSFPFGGMENPRLTFLSPTVIAGDKSLVSVVAHELAHSWSGNLVTNATWGDFWLNEGFTSYIENRIVEEIYGVDRAKLVESIGRRDLLEEINELGHDHEGTKLKTNLDGLNPDDAITSTPYDKGMAFLRMIELEVGREKFDAFLRAHFDDNAFQTLTTERMAERLRADLVKDDQALETKLQLDVWLYAPGVPPNLPPVDSALLTRIEKAAATFAAGGTLAEVGDKAWGSLEWVIFMRALPRAITLEQVAALDAQLSASTTGNSEIRFEWLKLVVANHYDPGVASLTQFVTTQGRRRLVEPMYAGLAKSEWGRPIAHKVYEQARGGYHPITRDTIDKLLQPQG